MKNYRDLEEEMYKTIRICCPTEEDEENAKEYFQNCSVSDLIDAALEE